MDRLRELTGRDGVTLAVRSADGRVRCYRGRGVADLYHLLVESPEVLRDSIVADKVIGKGAAALMALGGVRKAFGEIMSESALKLLESEGVEASYSILTDSIINRKGTGPCPVELLTAECGTAAECLVPIRKFLGSMGAV
ncbi:MAG: DUF1893 domain-containing protein [Paramuribaculum sp.]|nr:DUF1893 domain-containing protein [Paramuribaculum sp.]MDE7471252.1 DUF1893 domain-containing protein [Paramuribaculum sp.]